MKGFDEIEREESDEDDDEIEYFRIYTCTNNPVMEHCVEFQGKDQHREGRDYSRFPMFLRVAIDVLITAYPKPMPVLEIAKECGAAEEMLTAKQLIDFVKVLHGMRLVKLM